MSINKKTKLPTYGEFINEKKNLEGIIDLLSNSMEHYEEDEFVDSCRHLGFRDAKENSKIYNQYWKVGANERTVWTTQNWIEWLKGLGVKESVNEFTDDGSVYQLASGKNWKEVWTRNISIDGISSITISAGWTNTMKDVHTAVINVSVNGKLNKAGAEDHSTETIAVYFKDWNREDDAIKDLERFKNKIKIT